MYEKTGCDLVMVGRGSYGNPWIFEQIHRKINGLPELPSPTDEQKLAAMLHHVEMAVEFKGERQAIRESRRTAGFYLKGMKNSAKYRADCGSLNTLGDVKRLIEKILEGNSE